jgi:hypothetical protein
VPVERQAVVATHASHLAPDPTLLPELLGEIEANGATAYVAPGRITRDEWRNQPAPRGRIPTSPTRRDRMKRRLSTKAGEATYLLRPTTAEPVFGQIENTRTLPQVHHRGPEKVHAYWRFDCAVHTFLELLRYGPLTWIQPATPLNHRPPATPPTPTTDTNACPHRTTPSSTHTGG